MHPQPTRSCEAPASRSPPWLDTRVSDQAPTLSVGLAVRNDKDVVGRCIESVLSQDFTDLELVVCDNVSDDGTIALLESYARSDPRIVLSVNEVNIGSHRNMSRVLDLSRGTLFRWISADDWLEPGCLSACVRALESHPDAIGVTTWFTIHTADGASRYEEYQGEFPTSPDPARRFERMLWFFHAGDAKYDPVYGMYRRERLTRARPFRPSERLDWLLSAELALMGPIINVDKRLANRTRSMLSVSIETRSGGAGTHAGRPLRTSPRRLYLPALRSRGDGGPHGCAAAPLQAGPAALLVQGGGTRLPLTGVGCAPSSTAACSDLRSGSRLSTALEQSAR